jgi:hypothetical protein
MSELDKEQQSLLSKEFWTLNDLADFIGIKRQRIYRLISEEPERFPEHYKRRGLWESPPAPRILRSPDPKRQRRGAVMRYIEWWDRRNPIREAERMAG